MEDDAMPLYSQSYPDTKVVSSQPMAMATVSQPMPGLYATAPMPPQVQPLLLGPDNTVTTCPFCNASIKTAVKYTSTSRTHIAAARCAVICGCCCLPYCMDTAKNADHYCPSCRRYLGTYQR